MRQAGEAGEAEEAGGETDDEFQQVAILAIRKRPPYDYEDLNNLLSNLQ